MLHFPNSGVDPKIAAFGYENQLTISATILGISSAPPIPDIALAIMNGIKVLVKPFIKDQITNQAPPTRRIVLWP